MVTPDLSLGLVAFISRSSSLLYIKTSSFIPFVAIVQCTTSSSIPYAATTSFTNQLLSVASTSSLHCIPYVKKSYKSLVITFTSKKMYIVTFSYEKVRKHYFFIKKICKSFLQNRLQIITFPAKKYKLFLFLRKNQIFSFCVHKCNYLYLFM